MAWRKRVSVVGNDAMDETHACVVIGDASYSADLAGDTVESLTARFTEKARALVGARAEDVLQAMEADDLPAFAQLLTS